MPPRIRASRDVVLREIKSILSLKIDQVLGMEDKILGALREIIAINGEINKIVRKREALIWSQEKFLVLRVALSHVPELLYYIDSIWHSTIKNVNETTRYTMLIWELISNEIP